ncbi:MAG: TetR/AcrR family transcriptional regulator [Micromonosporaceae bacterium]
MADTRRRLTAGDTRQRLMAGAIAALRTHGIAGTSARVIATAAGANQALIFYHFGSVHELVSAACEQATRERLTHYRGRFDEVTTLRELLEVGRALHAEEQQLGHVAVLAQLLAGAQGDPHLATASGVSLRLWITEIERVLTRVLADSPIADALDVPGLARAISVGFIGMELYEAVDTDGAAKALAALDQLGAMVELIEDLGPISRRAVRSRLGRGRRPRPGNV